MPHDAPHHDSQPALHDLVTCLRAPTTVLSAADGQLRGVGAQGVLVADVRVIATALLTVGGCGFDPGGAEQPGRSGRSASGDVPQEPRFVAMAAHGADLVEFVSVVPTPWHPVPDPAVWIRRERRAEPLGCAESITVSSVLDQPAELVVRVRLATDLAGIWAIRAGRTTPPCRWRLAGGGAEVPDTSVAVTVSGGATFTLVDDETAVEVCWQIRVAPGDRVTVGWSVSSADPAAVVQPAGRSAALAQPAILADDRRLAPLVSTAVADLDALRMTSRLAPGDTFLAAGSPWYLTLFGRDSLWAARMLLPLSTDLAAGTLRTLAARQGTALDPITGEEPGKILHELRRADDGHAALPPVYYGTVDATPLWVCLLAESWRFGLDPAIVESLLPVAERALTWMAEYGDADGDGFLEYVDRSGHGLANQGWKDSSDSVRFADGRIATGPIALAEVQGYGHEAAVAGAELLDAFGHAGGDGWRDYAAGIAARFRERFWVSDDLGRYPAMALDADKRPVDAPASNMGHLLGTGMLTADESSAIAARLTHPSMASGFGLRTMASTAAGYSPLSYHCGTVWPHDTAIAIHGLLRAGRNAEAALLADGLLAAGAAFGGRLPELYGGFGADDIPVPVPYPAACRPQAWAAAAVLVLVRAFLGIEPDAPAGTVRVRPVASLGALRVGGLRVAGAALDVDVDTGGRVRAEVEGAALRVLG